MPSRTGCAPWHPTPTAWAVVDASDRAASCCTAATSGGSPPRSTRQPIPRHVGVILDGNRRWAKAVGARRQPTATGPARTRSPSSSAGATRSASRSSRCGCCPPTTSTGRRDELAPLLDDHRGRRSRPRRRPAAGGCTRSAPSTCCRTTPRAALKDAADAHAPTSTGLHVNVAVGYGGRREIADAVRSLLQEHAAQGTSIEELAEILDVEHIAEHLYTKGQPDPDLVIRTSGEQRLSGFLLWQSAHSEFYFCEALWPDFRKVDFLRALRAYAARERRFGS